MAAVVLRRKRQDKRVATYLTVDSILSGVVSDLDVVIDEVAPGARLITCTTAHGIRVPLTLKSSPKAITIYDYE